MQPTDNPAGVLIVGGGFIGSHVARGFVRGAIPAAALTRTPPTPDVRARLDGTRLLARQALPEVVNVGAGVGTTVAELPELVEEVTGETLDLRYEPARPRDVEAVVLDTALLQSLVDFEPTPLRDGLAATWSAIAHARVR